MGRLPLPAGLVLVSEKPRKKVKKKKVKTASQIGRASRRKGHGFEREVARELRKNGFPQACRQLEYQEGKGVDIANAGIYDIQCKRGKLYAPITKIEEVPKKLNRVAVLVTKADGNETLAVMPFNHFIEIMKK